MRQIFFTDDDDGDDDDGAGADDVADDEADDEADDVADDEAEDAEDADGDDDDANIITIRHLFLVIQYFGKQKNERIKSWVNGLQNKDAPPAERNCTNKWYILSNYHSRPSHPTIM